MTGEQLLARRQRAVAAGVGRLNPVTVASAREKAMIAPLVAP